MYRCALLALLLACTPESDQVTFGLSAMSFASSEWSAPVNLGPSINTAANENNPILSRDELSLYFVSNRLGTIGANDLWVARRDCLDCPWGAAVNLGAGINTAAGDGAPALSGDGHLLFFHSAGHGGQGGTDIFVTRRANPNDDFGWGPPVNLGPGVNTALFDGGASYSQSAEDGSANLYFGRGPAGNNQDIYYAAVSRDGNVVAPAVFVAELSHPTANDARASVRADGREVIFYSSRPGLGGNDLWMATRRSVHELWSAPVNMEALNTVLDDLHPTLSYDGRTLIFISDRAGGQGGDDIWISTRTPSGR